LAEPEQPTPPEAKTPLWKNPFVIAFVLGVIFLTVVPFLQRRFLRAPPPLATLPAWQVPTPGGGSVGGDTLQGRVWLANFVPAPCDSACVEKQDFFGRTLEHVDDLDGGVALVSFAQADAGAAVASVAQTHAGRWYVAAGSDAQLAPVLRALHDALQAWGGRDAGATPGEFLHLDAFVLVDQTGAVRGFWPADPSGRGNATNAARLLAKYGPNP